MVELHLWKVQTKLEINSTISFRDAYTSGETIKKSKEVKARKVGLLATSICEEGV